MLRVGQMQLSQPEPLDDLGAWAQGAFPDGGLWLDARRLADHDHSGGLKGLRVPSSSTGYWTFSTTPAAAGVDPSPGHVRSDTGALGTATLLVISLTTSEGTEMPGLAGTLGPGDSLFVQDRDDNTRHVRYDVTAPATNAPTHITVPVRVVAAAGAEVANNQTVAITFYLTSGGGGPTSVDITITGDAGIGVVENPANTFALSTRVSPDANNTLSLHGNGLYVAAGAIPPEYVTDAELTAALGPYATDADLAAHAAAADPHAGYVLESLADAKGDLLVATAGDTLTRLAAGSNGQFLTAQSAQATGLQWAANPVTAHEAAADPHPTYLTASEGSAAYAPASHNHDAAYVNTTGGDSMAGPLTVSSGGVAVTGASTFSVAPTVGGSALLTQSAGDARYRPIGYVTDVTVTGDNGVGVTESPANTFALATRLSADAGNALVLRPTGLYVSPAATDPTVLARLNALEAAMAVVRTHTHELGTFGDGTKVPAQVIP